MQHARPDTSTDTRAIQLWGVRRADRLGADLATILLSDRLDRPVAVAFTTGSPDEILRHDLAALVDAAGIDLDGGAVAAATLVLGDAGALIEVTLTTEPGAFEAASIAELAQDAAALAMDRAILRRVGADLQVVVR